jgi:hypothetical protein
MKTKDDRAERFETDLGNNRAKILAVVRRQRRICPTQNFQNQALHVSGLEGMLERGHFVKNTTERPNIALVVVRLVLTDFRRKVVRGADSCTCKLMSAMKNACNAEVSELDDVFLRKEDVLRFQIAVKDLAIVHMLQGKANLDKHVQNLIFSKMNSLPSGNFPE